MALTFNTRIVLIHDRVRTKTGRCGVAVSIGRNDTALIAWDDGEEFSIRFCHLEVLAHGAQFPDWYIRNQEPK